MSGPCLALRSVGHYQRMLDAHTAILQILPPWGHRKLRIWFQAHRQEEEQGQDASQLT